MDQGKELLSKEDPRSFQHYSLDICCIGNPYIKLLFNIIKKLNNMLIRLLEIINENIKLNNQQENTSTSETITKIFSSMMINYQSIFHKTNQDTK